MCQSCEALMINGVHCHETGCPDAWKDYEIECFTCGFDFMPEFDGQSVCDECQNEYHDAVFGEND
jgi:hypothetical protein